LSTSKIGKCPAYGAVRGWLKMNSSIQYQQVCATLSKPPEERSLGELQRIEGWFQRKSKILNSIKGGAFHIFEVIVVNRMII
jgi:hypothetical protein